MQAILDESLLSRDHALEQAEAKAAEEKRRAGLEQRWLQAKLDGLLLVIEGIGRRPTDGTPVLQALGIISWDDETGVYRMRAFNDGRWLETEVGLISGEKGMTWGFSLGEFRTNSSLRINEQGEWTELAELTIGSQPPRKLMELVVRPES